MENEQSLDNQLYQRLNALVQDYQQVDLTPRKKILDYPTKINYGIESVSIVNMAEMGINIRVNLNHFNAFSEALREFKKLWGEWKNENDEYPQFIHFLVDQEENLRLSLNGAEVDFSTESMIPAFGQLLGHIEGEFENFSKVTTDLNKDGTARVSVPERPGGSPAYVDPPLPTNQINTQVPQSRPIAIRTTRHGTTYQHPDGSVTNIRYLFSQDDLEASQQPQYERLMKSLSERKDIVLIEDKVDNQEYYNEQIFVRIAPLKSIWDMGKLNDFFHQLHYGINLQSMHFPETKTGSGFEFPHFEIPDEVIVPGSLTPGVGDKRHVLFRIYPDADIPRLLMHVKAGNLGYVETNNTVTKGMLEDLEYQILPGQPELIKRYKLSSLGRKLINMVGEKDEKKRNEQEIEYYKGLLRGLWMNAIKSVGIFTIK